MEAAVPDVSGKLFSRERSNSSRWAHDQHVSAYLTDYGLQPVEEHFFSKYLQPRMRVLDIGCGGGRVTINLHEAGIDVTGIDYSAPLVRRARGRFPYIDFRVGDARWLSFEPGQFDAVVFSYNGIDYLESEKDRALCLNEVKRVLKPKGLFIFSSHNIKAIPFGPLLGTPVSFSAKHLPASFGSCKKLQEDEFGGFDTFYTSVRYNVDSLTRLGFSVLELAGERTLRSRLFRGLRVHRLKENYVDPWVYYVARKE